MERQREADVIIGAFDRRPAGGGTLPPNATDAEPGRAEVINFAPFLARRSADIAAPEPA